MVLMRLFYILTSIISCLSIYGHFPSKLKIASALFALVSVIHFMIQFRKDDLKTIGRFFLEYSKYILILIVVSLIIYVADLSDTALIGRGFEKIFYQFLTILCAICVVYEFRDKAVEYTFESFALFNLLAMVLAFKDTGSASQVLSDLQYFISSGGDAQGYFRLLELHEVTFSFGLFLVYFLVDGVKKNLKQILISIFFFLVGFKRSGILGLLGAGTYYLAVSKLSDKALKILTKTIMCGFLAIGFGYVIFVRTGAFTALMDALNIDMMGRQNLYKYIEQFYQISPTYLGHGFESVRELLAAAGNLKIENTTVSKLTALHNDYLAMYIEMGFFGFFAWLYYRFVSLSQFCSNFGRKVYISCAMCSIYAGITYLTDNTSMYFYMVMIAWMIPLTFAIQKNKRTEYRKAYLSYSKETTTENIKQYFSEK